jgi:hypothetical protein
MVFGCQAGTATSETSFPDLIHHPEQFSDTKYPIASKPTTINYFLVLEYGGVLWYGVVEGGGECGEECGNFTQIGFLWIHVHRNLTFVVQT